MVALVVRAAVAMVEVVKAAATVEATVAVRVEVEKEVEVTAAAGLEPFIPAAPQPARDTIGERV